MASRTWLAVALACLVWFGYLKWFAPPMGPTSTPAPTAAAGSSPSTAPQGTQPTAPASADLFSVPTSAPAEWVELKNQDLKAFISPQGGRMARVEVFSHREKLEKDSPFMAPLDVSQQPASFATLFTEGSLQALNGAAYEYVPGAEGTHTFKATQGGASIEKVYQLPGDGHFVDLTVTVRPGAGAAPAGYLVMPLGGKDLKYDAQHPLEAWELVAYQNGSVVRHTLESLKEPEAVSQGTTGWMAFGNRYFASAVVNQSGINPDVVSTQRSGFTGGYLRFPLVMKSGETEMKFAFRLFVGPKAYEELSSVEGLKGLLDYGFFKIFAYPLLELLRWFNGLFHNYGVAIILLTLLVRLLFYPLSQKSFRSMKAMQKLQPQIAALKEKYKDDMQRFNQEQMALFRTHKVNPMGGCLPMLVQLPVFFALYTVLSNSIELFHAPFMGWIQDLSAKDPFYILPILMGISMFAQQKMTPAAGLDPMQQKMMLAMPVIFSFLMFNLPSGLTLYIFLSTILGIAQQVLNNRENSQGATKPAVSGSP